jgi:hypothetical protein
VLREIGTSEATEGPARPRGHEPDDVTEPMCCYEDNGDQTNRCHLPSGALSCSSRRATITIHTHRTRPDNAETASPTTGR